MARPTPLGFMVLGSVMTLLGVVCAASLVWSDPGAVARLLIRRYVHDQAVWLGLLPASAP